MPYPYYPNNYSYGAYQPQLPQTQQQMQPQIQNGGFVRVANEEEARKYPVAAGYSVTFIDENAEHCYTKTAGFSQLDQPVFVKYRLIRENTPDNSVSSAGGIDMSDYVKKSEFDKLCADVEQLRKDLSGDE